MKKLTNKDAINHTLEDIENFQFIVDCLNSDCPKKKAMEELSNSFETLKKFLSDFDTRSN